MRSSLARAAAVAAGTLVCCAWPAAAFVSAIGGASAAAVPIAVQNPRRDVPAGARSQVPPGRKLPSEVSVAPPAPSQPAAMRLRASPEAVLAGDRVRFDLEPAVDPKVFPYGLTIEFGDGTKEDLPEDRFTTTHVYRTGGAYTVKASLRRLEFIEPLPPPPAVEDAGVRVTEAVLKASPMTVDAGAAIAFEVAGLPDDPSLRFRFDFRDGPEQGWTESPRASHVFTASRTYEPSVEIGRASDGADPVAFETARSGPIEVRPAPARPTNTRDPSGGSPNTGDARPDPWWVPWIKPAAIAGAAFVLVLVVVQIAAKLFRGGTSEQPTARGGWTFRPAPDPGTSELAGRSALPIRLDVRVCPNFATLRFRVLVDEPSLVRSERRVP